MGVGMAKAPVLAILNMKGGVGKTTLTAHLMRELYRRHEATTLLIDLDPQFNLTQCVLTEKEYDAAVVQGKTVIAAFEPRPSTDFFEIKTSATPPPRAKEIAVTLKELMDKSARLDLICGDFNLVKYSLIDDAPSLNAALKYFRRFISQARDDYKLVVIDCNPSSSFITQCALQTSTHILSPVRPDKYSVIGVQLVRRLLEKIGPVPPPDQLIVMNGVARGSKPDSVETELRGSSFGSDVLLNRLHKSKLLAANPSYTGFATDKGVSWVGTLRTELHQLSDEIAAKLGI
jgi:chromosome partitioning protein